MFTGIITGLGQITDILPLGDSGIHGKRLRITTPSHYLDDVGLGDSIALNGACMTVTSVSEDLASFTVDVSAESLACTAGLDTTGPLNLEKALRAGDRLGGHIVSGHVDGVGRVTIMAAVGESWHLQLAAPKELAKFLAYKGSITVNGVSLTVNAVNDGDEEARIDINLIPHTASHTTLGTLRAQDRVNLEVDLIARYVERMLAR